MHDMGRARQGRAWRGMDLKPQIYPLSCRQIPAADGASHASTSGLNGAAHSATQTYLVVSSSTFRTLKSRV